MTFVSPGEEHAKSCISVLITCHDRRSPKAGQKWNRRVKRERELCRLLCKPYTSGRSLLSAISTYSDSLLANGYYDQVRTASIDSSMDVSRVDPAWGM